jgi:hypothetical protein
MKTKTDKCATHLSMTGEPNSLETVKLGISASGISIENQTSRRTEYRSDTQEQRTT